ncbi:MAG: GMC family oxidoreductase N-terminal domain-containing protein, partial [Rhodospirillales bacterium]|nr:GMC family oxidoreductase N-terminal domain-containing protein [Rhodospirillales bacterium]MCW9002394.1 GMC family oxidoreductase N-terminal domain-containing protein [Rhodospirillales bacterium]
MNGQANRNAPEVIDASMLADNLVLEGDVAIVGSGAGGGTAAEVLALAGLRVIIIEEGGLNTARDFTLRESDAYRDLYQDGGARKTADAAITILQGKGVGGSTTVNWTASFRTPPKTLRVWRERFGLSEMTEESLEPWFLNMERRLDIAPWTGEPNANNSVLARGAEKLGWHPRILRRNVSRCQNLGLCGLGCPVNAKRAMHVTTVPGALAHDAVLVTRAHAEKLVIRGGRIESLQCRALPASAEKRNPGRTVTVKARYFVSAAGGIGTPGLLLRSKAPDPGGLIGSRTFLHPTAVSVAVMPDRVDPFDGAPQSIYCDQFLWPDGRADGRHAGFKLEVPPMMPMLSAAVTKFHAPMHSTLLGEFPNMSSVIALMRDGFHNDSPGGTVKINGGGAPVLDYQV